MEEKEQDKLLSRKISELLYLNFDLSWDMEIIPQLNDSLRNILGRNKRKVFDKLAAEMREQI